MISEQTSNVCSGKFTCLLFIVSVLNLWLFQLICCICVSRNQQKRNTLLDHGC